MGRVRRPCRLRQVDDVLRCISRLLLRSGLASRSVAAVWIQAIFQRGCQFEVAFHHARCDDIQRYSYSYCMTIHPIVFLSQSYFQTRQPAISHQLLGYPSVPLCLKRGHFLSARGILKLIRMTNIVSFQPLLGRRRSIPNAEQCDGETQVQSRYEFSETLRNFGTKYHVCTLRFPQ